MSKKERVGRTDDDLLADVEKMKQQGKSKEEMRKELGIGMGRLYRLLSKLQSKTISPTREIRIPPPIEQAIINGTVNQATKKISDHLSEKYSRDYVGSMEAASVLKELEARYRVDVEAWGYKWEDFIRDAIDHAFKTTKTFKMWEPVMKVFFKEKGYYYQ